jgi:hypothetical protein
LIIKEPEDNEYIEDDENGDNEKRKKIKKAASGEIPSLKDILKEIRDYDYSGCDLDGFIDILFLSFLSRLICFYCFSIFFKC